MHRLTLCILLTGWIAWMVPFFLIKSGGGKPQQLDRRARWGIVLQGLAFALVWQGPFWRRSPGNSRLFLAIVFFALAVALSWTAARTLGRQWRFDAGLNPDHELVRAGAYRYVRHPIYLSMLCVLVATGVLFASPALLVAAIALAIAGTEIRVRIEDKLLAAHFGVQFQKYQHEVPAYIPFVR
jgi:protein-S-isoprenylcysteine O-methyltransferase Ste14